MLTGDSAAIGELVADELGLDNVYSELLPGDKVEHVEKLIAETAGKGALIFVGDGINDAPVLSRADVGVAMGALGSDPAIEAADVVLMNDRPSRIATAISIARRTRAIVRQNIVFALGVKGLVLVLSAVGLANMWGAVFADVGVAVLAILNAMRALKFGE
jgi:Cd2+/Zn2+-exporting ATPase